VSFTLVLIYALPNGFGLTLYMGRSGDVSSISVLNAHTTLREKAIPLPEDVQIAWDAFLMALEECPTMSPTADPNLGRAY
jgi:hypothetical protein